MPAACLFLPFNFMSCGCNSNLSTCNNPCQVSGSNTPACESLPSALQNFIDNFFGEIIKTEVDGAVTWALPCNLGTGLPGNPRITGEGLACYFLRLFSDGIT